MTDVSLSLHKDLDTYNEYVKYYYKTMPFLKWAKIIPVSAHDKIRGTAILDEAIKIHEKSKTEFKEADLEYLRKKIIRIHPPTIGRGTKKPRIYKLKQVSTTPLTFAVAINAKASLNESYLKFVEKKIREKFKLEGVAIITYVQKIKSIA